MQLPSSTSDRWSKLLGIAGFSSLTLAILVAHRNPTTAYELSIYTSTPALFWVGVVAAFLSAVALSLTTKNSQLRRFGLVLGGLSSFAVISLSITRGYFFQGIHDSVTHVGVTNGLLTGRLTPFETVYPALHTVSAFLSTMAGLSAWQSTFLVPLFITAGIFFVFVPLVVRALLGNEAALTVGAFSAFLLIPLHQLAATTRPHPSSQATLFAPIVVFFLIVYLRSPKSSGLFGTSTSVAVALLLSVFALILYHPMQALNVVALFVVISVFQFFFSKRNTTLTRWNHRPLYPIVISLSVAAYFLWIVQFPGLITIAQGGVGSVIDFLAGSSTTPGSAIQSQSSSLRAIGSSPTTVFLRLFAVSTIYIAVSGVVVIGTVAGILKIRSKPVDTNRLIVYFTGGLIAMGGIFGIYVVGNVGQYFFRQASFMMLIATIIGAVGVAYGASVVSNTRLRKAVVPALVIGFTLLFVLSSLTLYNSPYIFRANQQITEARIVGYDATFDITSEEAIISGVQEEPERYYQAMVGFNDGGRLDGAIGNSTQITQLQAQQQDDWYLVITRNTYVRELTVYKEHRFSTSDLGSLQHQADVNHVFSNGDLDLYYIP
ncbi:MULTISPECIES: hypothetical protein [Haloferax]|uniref:Glycosyltransferase RgtA/B/C/D-like domain-containing protein n=1 Tax=Haloferax marinum TaxID=2666143 RepID=A0A6A8GC49_9EURY|nr:MULTISPECIES: hypothetical protein [Haloferax]KAB1198509.1 hypothetical protein Hfx1150_13690 [Haloferax sp. CBA1150]MRW97616.1 hypothetical protein [Haloferax marinum]